MQFVTPGFSSSCARVHFINHKVLFCGWRKTQTFMRVLYSAAFIVAHTSLCWHGCFDVASTPLFACDSNCISGLGKRILWG